MNYSTIKKAVVFSLVSVLGLGAASAQDSTMTTMSSTAKVFGGRAQYRTWSFGLNAGVLAPVNVLGGSNDFTNWDVKLGYGATLRKQLGHAFGLELGFLRGDASGNNADAVGGVKNNRQEFTTELAYSGSIMGVVNVATMDFLKRENNVNFFVKAGYGIAAYSPEVTYGNGTTFNWNGVSGENRDEKFVQEQFIPVGAGIKFKVSERINFDLGYNMYFVDGDNFDGTYTSVGTNDKFSYGYGGLEFSLGSSAKPNLDWANPVAMMYDELKDPTLRQEVEALKGRVSTIETTVSDLLKDSDGDGVADKLDKCPNTEAGIKVDGSGCPLDVDGDGIVDSKDSCPTEKGTEELNGCPEMSSGTMAGYNNIQFEFNSSVLRTSAYPTLDKLSAEVRANSAMQIQLDGHASAEGTEEYNMQLSKDRANSVKTYLVNSGVDASKISTRGYGESRPVASNATEAGRSQNRRVEFRKR
ncbi:OmpA family protein [Daejeonella oryzae]|uniref:OmpA family protein n=1 Tax=Daejeonella oryzae TaxID=1122943 RepID=UPI00040FF47C|nr:OmpA family protein [Daejeonella oryzae]